MKKIAPRLCLINVHEINSNIGTCEWNILQIYDFFNFKY